MNQVARVLADIVSEPAGVVTVLVRLAPLYLVWAAGAVVALVRLGRHPAPSILVLVGLAVLFVVSFTESLVAVSLAFIQRVYVLSVPQLAVLDGAVNMVGTLVTAGAWALVLVAAFGWRRPPA